MSTPVGVEKLYVSLTATALGCSLCIVTWSVMLCIRAPGLALRGTGGSKSIDLAVLTLAGEDSEDDEDSGAKGDFADRMKRQMQLKAARMKVAQQKGKSGKAIERMSNQRMEEMIDFQESSDDSDGGKPAHDDHEKKSKLSLKRARRSSKEDEEDKGFRIAGERSGAERRELRQRKKLEEDREKETLAKLGAFSKSLRNAGDDAGEEAAPTHADITAEVPKSWRPSSSGGTSMADKLAAMDSEDEEEDEDDEGWMTHTLTFQKTAADLRRERAQMDSLEVKDSRSGKDAKYDQRSFHERRLKPDAAQKSRGPDSKGRRW